MSHEDRECKSCGTKHGPPDTQCPICNGGLTLLPGTPESQVERRIVEKVVPVARWGGRSTRVQHEAVLYRMDDGYFLSCKKTDRETGRLYEFANRWRERGEFHDQEDADRAAADYFDAAVKSEFEVVMGRIEL